MELTITIKLDPADYGKVETPETAQQIGLQIAEAIYNGWSDPPENAIVKVNDGEPQELEFDNVE